MLSYISLNIAKLYLYQASVLESNTVNQRIGRIALLPNDSLNVHIIFTLLGCYKLIPKVARISGLKSRRDKNAVKSIGKAFVHKMTHRGM